MITVVNRYKRDYPGPSDTVVYIGRGSILGNPYVMKNNSIQERNRVCDLYETWLRGHLIQRTPVIRDEMNRLFKIAINGNLTLECYCAPLRCHGDTIKKILKEAMEGRWRCDLQAKNPN